MKNTNVVHSNTFVNGLIENLYGGRSYMLISTFKCLLYYLFRELQVKDSFKYVTIEIHH